jgi:hypothetical protein
VSMPKGVGVVSGEASEHGWRERYSGGHMDHVVLELELEEDYITRFSFLRSGGGICTAYLAETGSTLQQ